jgi:hypothetical protein
MEDNVDRHGGQEAEECRTRRSKGMSSRGKGVFSSNFPELVTEVAPLVTEVPTSLECEDPQSEMGEEGRVVLAANDRHQDVVGDRKQQLLDYQPSLTEERRGVVPPHGRSAHLGREGAPTPQLPEVGNQGGTPARCGP